MIPVVNVQFRNFNTTGIEIVTPNEDGSYTVILNSRHTSEKQREAFFHALKHIHNNDFEERNVQDIETVAHTCLKR